MTTPLLAAVDQQARWCGQAGAPFFGASAGGDAARWLAEDQAWRTTRSPAVTDDPLAGAVALRLLSGLHGLALQGDAAVVRAVATGRQPARVEADDERLRIAVFARLALPHGEHDAARAGQRAPDQRGAAQRGIAAGPAARGAAQPRLPLALVEIGASAGLNLWAGLLPARDPGLGNGGPTNAQPSCFGRNGAAACAGGIGRHCAGDRPFRTACDLQPVDLGRRGRGSAPGFSYIWADQAERLERLRAAVAVARDADVRARA